MKSIWILVLTGTIVCSGCTSVSLEQYTLNQIRSGGETRNQSVMNCLAAVAANPDILPPFALYSGGTITVTDTINLGQTITWAPLMLTKEAFAATGSRSPKAQWTVDPSAEYQQLEALHAACLWALFGPERGRSVYPGILGDPRVLLDNEPHFGVEERLDKIPRLGPDGTPERCSPCARHKGHCGDMWVWVMPGDTQVFADFTLALQDIATLDPSIITTPPLLVTLTTYELTLMPDASDPSKRVTIATNELRAVKQQYRTEIEKAINEGITSKGGKVNLSRAQWLAFTYHWSGQRNSTGTTAIATPVASQAGRAAPTQLNPAIPVNPGGATTPPARFDLPK